jgi:hypothetical protein
VGSNRTQGMDVCVRLFYVCVVLCVGRGLATGWSLVRGVLPTVWKRLRNRRKARAQQRAVEPLVNEWIYSTYTHWSLTIELDHITYVRISPRVRRVKRGWEMFRLLHNALQNCSKLSCLQFTNLTYGLFIRSDYSLITSYIDTNIMFLDINHRLVFI